MRRFIQACTLLISIVAWSTDSHAARHPQSATKLESFADVVEAAYQYLESLPAHWAGEGIKEIEESGQLDCHTYDSAHIRGLSPSMAVRSANMAQAYKAETGVELAILSAYRSQADQKCVCHNVPKHCAGWRREKVGKDAHGKARYLMHKTGGHSAHERHGAIDMCPAGIDVTDDETVKDAYDHFHYWLRANEYRFGLHQPHFKSGDRAHIEPVYEARVVRKARYERGRKSRHARR